jgi:hypothetical protein
MWLEELLVLPRHIFGAKIINVLGFSERINSPTSDLFAPSLCIKEAKISILYLSQSIDPKVPWQANHVVKHNG